MSTKDSAAIAALYTEENNYDRDSLHSEVTVTGDLYRSQREVTLRLPNPMLQVLNAYSREKNQTLDATVAEMLHANLMLLHALMKEDNPKDP